MLHGDGRNLGGSAISQYKFMEGYRNQQWSYTTYHLNHQHYTHHFSTSALVIMAKVQGNYDPAFTKLEEFFQEKISSGEEVGASINININGKDVVDIWAGHADEEKTKPWTADTITNVYSSTKTIAAIAILLAHERGLLSVDDPVAKHWPEFAANGKENVLIRHVMSHTSGVSGWEGPITMEEVCDVPTSTARLAAQAPFWEPGTASGYHATTQGHLLGEIIRRATGVPMAQFVATELATPTKADFQIGAQESDWPRIAPVIPPPPPAFDIDQLDKDSVMFKSFFNPRTDANFSRDPLWRKADMSAVNGHGTAKGLNRILRLVTLAGTEHDQAKLLSSKTVEQIFRVQSEGVDQALMCFWTGWGGSFAICDLQRGVTFSYVMNKMGGSIIGNDRSVEYARMAWEIVKEGEKQ